jgi:hypothetical protein
VPRLSRLSLLFAAVLCVQAPAQPQPSAPTQTTPAKSETDQLVDQLIENATRNRAALPSLTAHESITTKLDEVVFFGRNGDKAKANVRLVRKSPDSSEFKETRQLTMLNKKTAEPGQHTGLMVDYYDDFNDWQSVIFSVQHRACFSFVLAPHSDPAALLLLTISPLPDTAKLPDCAITKRGLTGSATIDPAAHQITHLEFTLSNALNGPSENNLSPSIDYAPAKVGDKTFWLPTTVAAHFNFGKSRWEWHSRYSDYHQYTSTVKLLPETPNSGSQSER